MKVGIYARYSSENQRDASITDQLRVCREFAQRQGWHIEREYSDHAISGATIRGPRGALWSPSTIHGNPKHGVGILHNELYVGRMVWNKLRNLKDPDTGKRVSRPNAESEWVVSHVPALRIIDDELWQAVHTRYAGVQRKWKSAERGKRFNQFVFDCADPAGRPVAGGTEGESGRDVDCRPENEKVAGNWRPSRADSNGCGGGFEPPTFGL